MFRFIAGFASVWLILLGWAKVEGQSSWSNQFGGWIGNPPGPPSVPGLVELFVLPVGLAWLVADLSERLSPRRAFDMRVRARWLVALGIASGVLSAGLAAGLMVLGVSVVSPIRVQEWKYLDVAAVGIGCVLGVIAVMAVFRRARRGCCVQCGYDLSGSVSAICPECGAAGSGIA